ncbi:MAG: PLDc N-terminal domain-containing protein [Candidatus Methanofastidiosia archaeon]
MLRLFFGGFGYLVAIVWLIVFIWALVDIIQRKDLSTIWKIIWIVVCFFLGIIGVIIYVLIGRK